MLLWPHPLLPDEGFIDPANDMILLRQAEDRLLKFDFIDVIDDGEFVARLGDWVGQRFQYKRENETTSIADAHRLPLHRELTPDAVQLLEDRSRLDQRIWSIIAARRMPAQDAEKLRERTLLTTIARHALLLAN